MKQKLLVLLFSLLCLTTVVSFHHPKSVSAAGCGGPIIAFGRQAYSGYFTNDCDYFGDVVLSGGAYQTDLSSFEAYIDGLRNGSGSDKTGADFIILTMLGYSGGAHGDSVSDDEFNEWKARIEQPAVTIDWNKALPWSCGQINTYNQGSDVAPYITKSGDSETNPCGPGNTVASIVFYYNGVQRYAIKRNCGNPVGALKAIPLVQHWSLSGSTVIKNTAGTVITTAIPGQHISFYHTVANAAGEDTASYCYILQKQYPGDLGIENFSPTSGGVAYHDGGLCTAKAGGYYGNNATTASGSYIMPGYGLNIPTTATEGQKYCQRIFFSEATGPGTASGAGALACVTVIIPPTVNGVKIDASGTGGYGGACAPVGRAAPNCTGTTANYPFSSDPIVMSGANAGTMSKNPFGSADVGVLSSGSTTFTDTPSGTTLGAGWVLIGYSYCDQTNATDPSYCGATDALANVYLMTHVTYKPTGAVGQAATVNLADDTSYAFRWIYAKEQCSVTAATGASQGVQVGDNNLTLAFDLIYSSVSDVYKYLPSNAVEALNYEYTAISLNPGFPGVPATIPAPTLAWSNPSPGIDKLEGLAHNVTAPNVADTYPSDWNVTSNSPLDHLYATPYACKSSLEVKSYPYFKVLNSGISAGATFPNSTGTCVIGTSGELAGWNNNNGTNNRGAGADDAALAALHIDGFGSAQKIAGSPGSTNATAYSLSLANNSSNLANLTDRYSPRLGGGFGAVSATNCLTTQLAPTGSDDLHTTVPTTAGFSDPIFHDSPPYTDKDYADQDYIFENNLLLGGGTLASSGGKGQPLSLFVSGNVYISGNIDYQGSGDAPGDTPSNQWTTASAIPSFVLVATGNIYIDPNVTNLDGLFVAQPNTAGVGGKIYTCGTSAMTPMVNTTLYTGCNKQLIIHGSFVASQVNLMRTFGTLNAAKPSESANPSASNCIIGTTPLNTCAAEVFDFSPEFYLAKPAVKLPNNGVEPYDSIASLPPIL